jgi:hypothetical protein
MGQAGVAGFDKNGRPIMQKTGQISGKKQNTDDTKINTDNNTPPPPPGGSATPPPDRGGNPGRKPRAKKQEPGFVQDEINFTPPKSGKKTGATSAGGLNPLNETDAADVNKRANITGDGAAPSANTPAVVKPTSRKPRTPKAGA